MKKKWDERASDSFKRFELEEEFKEEMARRKTQYSMRQPMWPMWMVALDMTLLVLISIPFVYLIMLITR